MADVFAALFPQTERVICRPRSMCTPAEIAVSIAAEMVMVRARSIGERRAAE